MEGLVALLWRPVLALVMLILDPLRAISGLILGFLARPWWVVFPGAIVLSLLMEFVYVKVWSHAGSFNSVLAGFFVALIAAWTGLSWRGRAPRLTNAGPRHG